MFLSEVKTFLVVPRIFWGRFIHCSAYKLQLDYYKVLGLTSNATDKEIKRAYLQKCKDYHPDKHRGSKAMQSKFIEANEAYNVLSDEIKRREYDARLSNSSYRPGYQHHSPYRWGNESRGPSSNPEDVFREYNRERQRFESHRYKRQRDPFYDYWERMYKDSQNSRDSFRDYPFGSSGFSKEELGTIKIARRNVLIFLGVLFFIIFLRVYIAIKTSGRHGHSIPDPDYVRTQQPYSYNDNKRPKVRPSEPSPIDFDVKTEEA